jgi:hypothetical protein
MKRREFGRSLHAPSRRGAFPGFSPNDPAAQARVKVFETA